VLVGGGTSPSVEGSRREEALVRGGVPAAAIIKVDAQPTGTSDELRLAARALQPSDDPIILVTSAYHTRRVLLAWDWITGAHPRGILHSVPLDTPFDPDAWWERPQARQLVVHEYLGLLQLVAGGTAR
jgi:uncharacterized SAM-binding protein YcdF (DUF218 family)